jgi:hypothetical protein
MAGDSDSEELFASEVDAVLYAGQAGMPVIDWYSLSCADQRVSRYCWRYALDLRNGQPGANPLRVRKPVHVAAVQAPGYP